MKIKESDRQKVKEFLESLTRPKQTYVILWKDNQDGQEDKKATKSYKTDRKTRDKPFEGR